MAELSYGDVQRAVRDGLQNVQSGFQRLASQVSRGAQQQAQIDNLQQTIQQLNGTISRLEQQMRRHDPYTEQMTTQLARDVQDLKARFVTVEKFCQDMSKYVQSKHEEELERKQYRSV